jgi:hypothetical protein
MPFKTLISFYRFAAIKILKYYSRYWDIFFHSFTEDLLQDSRRYAECGRGAQKMYTDSTSMGHRPA